MSVKDRYGNNLRYGTVVRDLRPGEYSTGIVQGSDLDSRVHVLWDGQDEEETVRGEDVVVKDRSLGGRRRR